MVPAFLFTALCFFSSPTPTLSALISDPSRGGDGTRHKAQ